jgi:hypothetical protein
MCPATQHGVQLTPLAQPEIGGILRRDFVPSVIAIYRRGAGDAEGGSAMEGMWVWTC